MIAQFWNKVEVFIIQAFFQQVSKESMEPDALKISLKMIHVKTTLHINKMLRNRQASLFFHYKAIAEDFNQFYWSVGSYYVLQNLHKTLNEKKK